jgi:hypothetical protein
MCVCEHAHLLTSVCLFIIKLKCVCVWETADVSAVHYLKHNLLSRAENSIFKMCSDVCGCITYGICSGEVCERFAMLLP